MHDTTMDPAATASVRRPYAAPALRVYGDLRELTLTNLTQNMNDPGNSSTSMT
jgi:hypothetical protein